MHLGYLAAITGMQFVRFVLVLCLDALRAIAGLGSFEVEETLEEGVLLNGSLLSRKLGKALSPLKK
jgi:hypothetical protein